MHGLKAGIIGRIIVKCLHQIYLDSSGRKNHQLTPRLGIANIHKFRDDKAINIQAPSVDPGDIVDVTTGNSVPADIRLIHAVKLEADETLLMSESVPVPKNPKATFDDDTSPDDRLNVAYSSTIITKGCGRIVVFAVSMYTDIGHIVSVFQGEDLTGKGVEWEPRAAQPGSVAKMWSKATIGWLSKFLGLTVGTPLQKKLVQLFLWLLAFAIVRAVIMLGANKFDTSLIHTKTSFYVLSQRLWSHSCFVVTGPNSYHDSWHQEYARDNVTVRNLSSLEALGGVANIESGNPGQSVKAK